MYTDVVRSFSSGKNSMRYNLVTPSELSYWILWAKELWRFAWFWTDWAINFSGSWNQKTKEPVCQSVSQPVGQSIRMTDCFSNWLAQGLVDWLIDWLTGKWIDWLTNWFFNLCYDISHSSIHLSIHSLIHYFCCSSTFLLALSTSDVEFSLLYKYYKEIVPEVCLIAVSYYIFWCIACCCCNKLNPIFTHAFFFLLLSLFLIVIPWFIILQFFWCYLKAEHWSIWSTSCMDLCFDYYLEHSELFFSVYAYVIYYINSSFTCSFLC